MGKEFSKVYYIVQTKPFLRTCGYSFSRKQAQAIAKDIRLLTGEKGKVIEFSRDELKDLEFIRPIK